MNTEQLLKTSGENSTENISILIVDKDRVAAQFIVSMLSSFQASSRFHCVHLPSLQESIELIHKVRFDVVLLDSDIGEDNPKNAVQRLRQSTPFAPIIVMTQVENAQVSARWLNIGVDDCIEKSNISGRILSRMITYAKERALTVASLQRRDEEKRVLNALLKLTLENLPLEILLQRSLEHILTLPFTQLEQKGGIFIADEQTRMLQMVAQVNLPDNIQSMCAKVPFGHCICGRAASQKTALVEDSHSELHDNRYDGMMPHGHFSLPILHQERIIGLLVLYVSFEHRHTESELDFLTSVTDTLAGIMIHARALHKMEQAYQQNHRVLSSITSILIGVDEHDIVTHWNEAADRQFELNASQVIGNPFTQVNIPWDWTAVSLKVLECMSEQKKLAPFDINYHTREGKNRVLSFLMMPFLSESGSHPGFLMVGEDVTEQKIKEGQRLQAQKLQTIGQLASGIAHEINTPIQYVGDNIQFLKDAFEDIHGLIGRYQQLDEFAQQDAIEIYRQIEQCKQSIDWSFLQEEIPSAMQQSEFGIAQVAKIVSAMKDFSHPSTDKKDWTNLNQVIENIVTVSRNVWKYAADIQLALDKTLPQVSCYIGLMNEVLLNLLVNAVHAIETRNDSRSNLKGSIIIQTRTLERMVEIQIRDNGSGIEVADREHVFDPFFTTKEIGKGTGQGLSLSHDIVVQKHNGELYFETQVGQGTTFFIRLPVDGDE